MERGPKGASDRVVSDRKRIYIYKYIYIIEERLISDAHLLLVSVLHGCNKKNKTFGIVKGWAHISCVSALA